ncbi:MAG: hypothetical protein IPL78_22335 [Chloroflexi bacterium]|nr:hypothetical protein [Chloroflexota bacterium]
MWVSISWWNEFGEAVYAEPGGRKELVLLLFAAAFVFINALTLSLA